MSHLRKVHVGERLRGMSAGDWNTFIDTARFVEGLQPRGIGSPAAEPQQTVRVKNSTGAALALGAVVRIGAPLFGPSDNLAEFKFRTSFSGDAPASDTSGRIGILSGPLAVGGIGRAVVSGYAICKVDVTDTSTDNASEVAAQTGYLRTNPLGRCRIIWRESGSSGQKWAVVSISPFAATVIPTHDITATTAVLTGDTPSWRYTLQAVSAFTSGSWASAGTTKTRCYNLAEDQTNYQHGQTMVTAGGTLTVTGPVAGPVNAFPTVISESGETVWVFDAPNPMGVTCGAGESLVDAVGQFLLMGA